MSDDSPAGSLESGLREAYEELERDDLRSFHLVTVHEGQEDQRQCVHTWYEGTNSGPGKMSDSQMGLAYQIASASENIGVSPEEMLYGLETAIPHVGPVNWDLKETPGDPIDADANAPGAGESLTNEGESGGGGPPSPFEGVEVWGSTVNSLPQRPVRPHELQAFLDSSRVESVRIPKGGGVIFDESGPAVTWDDGSISEFQVMTTTEGEVAHYRYGYPEVIEGQLAVPRNLDEARREGFVQWWSNVMDLSTPEPESEEHDIAAHLDRFEAFLEDHMVPLSSVLEEEKDQ